MSIPSAISGILLFGLLSGCMSPIGLFEVASVPSEEDHIGTFYSTTVFEDHLSKDVWFSKEAECIQVNSQSEHVYSGEGALHIVWDKGAGNCPWLGLGFGWDNWAGKDMSKIYDRAAISFKVRTDGNELSSLPVALCIEDYGDQQAWVGFSRKMMDAEVIGKDWVTVTIPILAFNWTEFGADVSNVKQFMIQFEASGDIYMDDVRIVESAGTLRSRTDIPLDIAGNVLSQNEFWFNDREPTVSLAGNKIFLALDKDNLYVVAEVLDSDPMQNTKEGDEIWNGDALEIAFSMNSDASPSRGYFLSTDKHIGIRISDDPLVWNWRSHNQVLGAKVQTISIPKGYLLQVKIPLAELGNAEFKVEELYGFEIALDQGNKEARKVQYRWNSPDTEGFHQNPLLWGEARIIEIKK
jgi:hypothetical protein